MTARPAPPRRTAGQPAVLTCLALLAAAAFSALAVAVDGRTGTGLDRDGFASLADLRAGWLTGLAKVLTNAGSSVVVGPILVAAVVWLLRGPQRAGAAALGLGGVCTFALVHLLKAGIDRPRPTAALVHTTLASFPSGHAAYSVGYVAIAFVLATQIRRRRALALGSLAALLALIVGFTRVYLRAHYVTDVLAGWALGVACFAGTAAAAITVARMRHNARSS